MTTADKRSRVLSWVDEELTRVTAIPVINSVPGLAPGQGQEVSEIVNFRYARLLRAIASAVPHAPDLGFFPVSDSERIEALYSALVEHDALPFVV